MDNDEMIFRVSLAPDNIPYTIPTTSDSSEEFDYYPNAVLLQYTGLTDKNGKEIYEGDIVESFSEEDGHKTLVVKFYAYQGTFSSGFSLFDEDMEDDFYHDKVEVIGNIYENKELLK